MALKFRRGTTAQKSGSLAFGEPYVNSDLATLQIGGAVGDITLMVSSSAGAYEAVASGTHTLVSGSSQITFSGISSLPTLVSGSSQITLSSTTGGATSSNVQFNSLGIGTAGSGTTGEIRATADITAYYSSDRRLKENITPIPNALAKILKISGNTFDWKDGFSEIHSHTGEDVGVVAQEIEEVLPQIVIDRETGYKAVQYEKLVALLIEGIKEQQSQIDELKFKLGYM
jgi:hypothetical protein